ncbi:MAG TPA: DUF2127 domain-containing protein [Acidimicrobiales bacterium]|nr:DUF2127 domain-containing protein [Acidimicrobiales bacterium]
MTKTAPPNRYELLTCALQGHVLVGVGAARVEVEDAAVVRETGGLRRHRCLRCDAWVPLAPPTAPTSERVPSRRDIEVPLRGPLLRDRYVLRLIAVDRAIHVLLLTSLALVVFFFAGDHAALQRDYNQIIDAFGGPTRAHTFLGRFRHYFTISTGHLYAAALVVTAYAALEAVEMVGLWLAKRWAEYLTFVATAALIPLEVYEIVDKPSVLKIVTLVVNVAIAAYLLWAKRLFGLHGGQRAEEARKEAAVSWETLEAAVPDLAAAQTAATAETDPAPA